MTKHLQQSFPKVVADTIVTDIKAKAASMKDLTKEVAKETAMAIKKNFYSAW